MDEMNRTKVKICGLQSRHDCRMLSASLVDFAGFVLTASRRRVTPDQVRAMKLELDPRIKTVGVFTDESAQRIAAIALALRLDVVQLHHDPCAHKLSQLASLLPERCKIWQRLAMRLDESQAQQLTCLREEKERLQNFPTLPDAILLDSQTAQMAGGTGRSFSLDGLETLSFPRPLVVAGGLDAHHVGHVIRSLHPAVVDCSSGVEKEGKKDEDLIKAFCLAVQNAP